MAKIDYRKIKALTDEIFAELANDLPHDESQSLVSSAFSELIKLIKKDLQIIRQTLINEIATKPASGNKVLPPETGNVKSEKISSPVCAIGSKEISKITPATKKLSEPAGIPEKLKEKKLVEKISSDRSLMDETVLKKTWVRGLAICVVLPLLVLFIYAKILDSKPDHDPIKFAAKNSELPLRRSNNYDFPAVSGKKRAAEDAFEKGKTEMAKKNMLAAAEYFRLALSLEPANEAYIIAFKEATGSTKSK